MRLQFPAILLGVLAIAGAGWVVSTGAAASPSELPALSDPLPAPSLLVASLNLAMSDSPEAVVREIRNVPALDRADVLLIQEVVRSESADASVAEEAAQALGLHAAFASPDNGRGTFGGLAILSREPLRDVRSIRLQRENLVFRSRNRIALAATVDSRHAGAVRVINAHLDTRINPSERVRQLSPALDDASAFDGPSIIGGDFNTNDMQWVSNIVPVPFPGWQAARVRALMESRGFRTAFQKRRATFDHMGMQLDWIYTNRLNAIASGIRPVEISDHHAVWVQFVR